MANRNLAKAIENGIRIAQDNGRKAAINSLDFYELANKASGKVDAATEGYLIGLAIGYELGKKG